VGLAPGGTDVHRTGAGAAANIKWTLSQGTAQLNYRPVNGPLLAINPALFAKMPHTPLKDLTSIGMVTRHSMCWWSTKNLL
jgi:hypothetical protein